MATLPATEPAPEWASLVPINTDYPRDGLGVLDAIVSGADDEDPCFRDPAHVIKVTGLVGGTRVVVFDNIDREVMAEGMVPGHVSGHAVRLDVFKDLDPRLFYSFVAKQQFYKSLLVEFQPSPINKLAVSLALYQVSD